MAMRRVHYYRYKPGWLHPVAAGLLAACAFAAASAVANLAWRLLVAVGLDRLLGDALHWPMLFLALLAATIAAARPASWSRSGRSRVVFWTAVALAAFYLLASWLGPGFVTAWLYPDWPGVEPSLSLGSVLIAALGGFFFLGMGQTFAEGAALDLHGPTDVDWVEERTPRRRTERGNDDEEPDDPGEGYPPSDRRARDDPDESIADWDFL